MNWYYDIFINYYYNYNTDLYFYEKKKVFLIAALTICKSHSIIHCDVGLNSINPSALPEWLLNGYFQIAYPSFKAWFESCKDRESETKSAIEKCCISSTFDWQARCIPPTNQESVALIGQKLAGSGLKLNRGSQLKTYSTFHSLMA